MKTLKYLIIIVLIGIAPDSRAQIKAIEKVWVPDSVFSPHKGIDFDFVVWNWQWRNGYSDRRPFKNYDAYLRAVEYQGFRDSEPAVIPSDRLPTEPDYFNNKYFQVIERNNTVPILRDSVIYLVEEEISPFDPDTAGAHFSSYDDFGQPYQPWNSRYRLYVEGKLILTFKAYASWSPAYPIRDTEVWSNGYSFLYQQHGIEWNNIHAVVNGNDLNNLGFDKTCSATYLDEKLFFLFEKNGAWGWSYDGVEHADVWDQVYYHHGDGEAGPHSSPSWRGICALRNGMWYMVRFEREQ